MFCRDGYHECDGCGMCQARRSEYCADCGAYIGDDYDTFENADGDVICLYCFEHENEDDDEDV